MIPLVFAAVAGIIFLELLIRTPAASSGRVILKTAQKSAEVMTSKAISDHWKEKVLLAYSLRIATKTILLLTILLSLLAVLYLLDLVSVKFLATELINTLSSLEGMLVATIAPCLYWGFRKRLSAETDYSLLDRIMHRLAFQTPNLMELSFDLEQSRLKLRPDATSNKPHVFIAGLARAGTTVIMREFFATNRFTSFTYRHMPFVLMPRTWTSVFQTFWNKKELSERAHGDRILVNYDSPEAFEEVFWKTIEGDRYLQSDCITEHSPEDSTVSKFKALVLSLVGPNGVYLSKNNNNIVRLPAIRKAFPRALIVVPFREPSQQAASLLRMHKKFLALHSKDKFARSYMTWLGHHEFGADHRRFELNKGASHKYRDPKEISYWLELWCDCYDHLLTVAPSDSVFLSYEKVCSEQSRIIPALLKKADVESVSSEVVDQQPRRNDITEQIPNDLKARSAEIYQKLEARHKL